MADFLFRLGAQRADVDDLVQEVFLAAHRRGGFVPGPARPTTWLAAIALRVLSTSRRTRRRRPEAFDAAHIARVPAADASPLDLAEANESLMRIAAALSRMDLAHRAVFVLYEIEEESCAEIAAALGVPLGTVYSRLHAARHQILAAAGVALADTTVVQRRDGRLK